VKERKRKRDHKIKLIYETLVKDQYLHIMNSGGLQADIEMTLPLIFVSTESQIGEFEAYRLLSDRCEEDDDSDEDPGLSEARDCLINVWNKSTLAVSNPTLRMKSDCTIEQIELALDVAALFEQLQSLDKPKSKNSKESRENNDEKLNFINHEVLLEERRCSKQKTCLDLVTRTLDVLPKTAESHSISISGQCSNEALIRVGSSQHRLGHLNDSHEFESSEDVRELFCEAGADNTEGGYTGKYTLSHESQSGTNSHKSCSESGGHISSEPVPGGVGGVFHVL